MKKLYRRKKYQFPSHLQADCDYLDSSDYIDDALNPNGAIGGA